MLIAEGKIFSRQQLEIFPYYSQKIGFDISGKWCHPFIFWGKKNKKKKNKKKKKKQHRNTTNLASVNFAQRTRVVKVDDKTKITRGYKNGTRSDCLSVQQFNNLHTVWLWSKVLTHMTFQQFNMWQSANTLNTNKGVCNDHGQSLPMNN